MIRQAVKSRQGVVRSLVAAPTKKTVPFRHSRNKLPPVCIDTVQRAELTQQVLQAPQGSLFTYQGSISTAEAAWQTADVTCQKVEYLLRGHAHSLSGTQWNRWVKHQPVPDPSASASNADETLETMQNLIERLHEEGYLYMRVRDSRLEELHGLKPADGSGDKEPLTTRTLPTKDREELLLKAGLGDLLLDEDDDELMEGLVPDTQPAEETEGTYMEDFALPGPTVNMYDCLLDAMACQTSSKMVSLEKSDFILERIVGRHTLDGGDAGNLNPNTSPTAQSFNAGIRVAAGMPYDITDKSSVNVKLRDDAILLAFGAFDAINHSAALEGNSATYTHLLNLVAKYFPRGVTCGNIAHGMFKHARQQGIIDDGVISAYLAANEPSNATHVDEFIENNLHGKTRKELPFKWTRYSRIRRHHPREATY
jgi:hypothetical protein